MENAHVAAVIEDLRGQFRVFGEAVQATNEKLDGIATELGGVTKRLTGVEGQLTDVTHLMFLFCGRVLF